MRLRRRKGAGRSAGGFGATIKVVQGEHAGRTLTIRGLTDEDVARARTAVREDMGHPLVLLIVAAYREAIGESEPVTGVEYLSLLCELGLDPLALSDADEAALTALLIEGAENGG